MEKADSTLPENQNSSFPELQISQLHYSDDSRPYTAHSPLPQTAHLSANPGQGMGGVMGLDGVADWGAGAGDGVGWASQTCSMSLFVLSLAYILSDTNSCHDDKDRQMQTNKGWIFCLNSDYDAPESGSSWGYVEDFLKDIKSGNKASSKEIRFRSTVYGKPCRKDLRLGPGDAIAFYHGKKARRAMRDLSPVKPYQLSMIAFIDAVEQEEDGNVDFLACSIPRSLYDHLCAHPLKKDDERVADIIASTGLGGGAVGSFFPIDYTNWKKLKKIAMP